MKLSDTELELSATDLSNFLGCRHRTGLDMAAAHGERKAPYTPADPLLELLWARGLQHEALYVESLRASGRSITDLRKYDEDRDVHVAKTLDAMRAGADVIVQGALRDGRWFGKPDVLRRVATPSAFGDWSYEVIDTKLSKETRAGTILQLCLYSEMLGLVQELRPEYFYVVTPDKVKPQHEYRLDDYAAYFRLVRSQMLATLDLGHEEIIGMYYPEPVEHCEICRWERQCDARRREDDHLSLIAGISRLQRRELESRDITTLAQLARTRLSRGALRAVQGRLIIRTRSSRQSRPRYPWSSAVGGQI
jgi:predicted RecB family nuclease